MASNMNYYLLLLSFLFPFFSLAQFQEDFSDGDLLNDPVWTGDLSNFQVTAGELQLNDDDFSQNTSQLLSAVATAGMTTWDFYVRLEFSPSSSNFAKVYLASTNSDLDAALDGYYIKIGGITGSDDALELYKQKGTTSELLLSGMLGGVGNDPAVARVQVVRDADNNWELLADYTGGNNLVSQGIVSDNEAIAGEYFGFWCKYTSTRKDKFFFDDIQIDPVFSDNAAPVLLDAAAVSSIEVDLKYNEALDAASVENATYELSDGILVSSASLDATDATLVHLVLENDLVSGTNYTIIATGISDTNGNISTAQSFIFTYIEVFTAAAKDILINEFMADPTPQVGLPDAEYIELYNNSDQAFNLENFGIASGGDPIDLGAYILASNTYVILCKNEVADLFEIYGAVLVVDNLPSLTNGSDEIVLTNEFDEIIDAVYYTDNWYQDSDKKDGGWSLELINPFARCQAASTNWIASNNAVGGTPGQANSVQMIAVDESSPLLESAVLESSNQIILNFDETLDIAIASNPANYIVSNDVSILEAIPQAPDYKQVILLVAGEFEAGTTYNISVLMMADCIGNFTNETLNISVSLPELAEEKDIIINEILFNPFLDGVDFVELYNRSTKLIDLKDCVIRNNDNGREVTILNNYILSPNEYVVITENKQAVIDDYEVRNEAAMIEQALPDFNQDDGNVSLYLNEDNMLLDAFDYTEDYHSLFLDDKKGVSLERINPDGDSQASSNWHSASSTAAFATPTYQNSQFLVKNIDSDATFSLSSTTFSPDGDGFQDFLLINYQTDIERSSASIKIFDSKGRLVKELENGAILGSSGHIRWNGDTDSGKKGAIGIYIIWIELFSEGGKVATFKEVCVLAGQLR